jgi:hypothetical protein
MMNAGVGLCFSTCAILSNAIVGETPGKDGGVPRIQVPTRGLALVPWWSSCMCGPSPVGMFWFVTMCHEVAHNQESGVRIFPVFLSCF